MSKKKLYIYFTLLLALSSCEIFVIKAPPKEQKQKVELSQRAPLSVVYLFKAELDSNNVFGAMNLIKQNTLPSSVMNVLATFRGFAA